MKKGFTLVEIIISITLIAIIGVASIFIFIKKEDNVENEVEEIQKELSEVSDIYYTNNSEKKDFKYYENDHKAIVTCMKLETLVNEGLIREDSTLLTTYSNDDVFKYIINAQGAASIEPVIDPNDKTCEYIKVETSDFTGIDDDDESDNKYEVKFKDIENEEWKANYDYTFKKGTNSDFEGTITFDMELNQDISIETIKDLYVALVMDRSGSMAWTDTDNGYTRYYNAIDGVDTFISTLRTIDDEFKEEGLNGLSEKIRLASIGYNNSATLYKNFIELTDVTSYANINFPDRSQIAFGPSTNCKSGLEKAENIFRTITTEETVKIIIFLSDGICDSKSTAVSKATDLKNSGIQIFSIGYGDSADSMTLSDIASSSTSCDIPNFTTTKICSFQSDTSKLSTTFKNLAKSTVQSAKYNPYNEIVFSIKLSEYFTFTEEINTDRQYGENNNYYYEDSLDTATNTLTRKVTIVEKESFKTLNITNFNYKLNFLADKYKEANSQLTVGERKSVPLDILSEIKINMSGSGNPTDIVLCSDSTKECYSDTLPKVTVDLSNNSVIN